MVETIVGILCMVFGSIAVFGSAARLTTALINGGFRKKTALGEKPDAEQIEALERELGIPPWPGVWHYEDWVPDEQEVLERVQNASWEAVDREREKMVLPGDEEVWIDSGGGLHYDGKGHGRLPLQKEGGGDDSEVHLTTENPGRRQAPPPPPRPRQTVRAAMDRLEERTAFLECKVDDVAHSLQNVHGIVAAGDPAANRPKISHSPHTSILFDDGTVRWHAIPDLESLW